MNFIRMSARRMPPTVSHRWAMHAAWLASANERQELFAEHWRARLEELRDLPALVERVGEVESAIREAQETIGEILRKQQQDAAARGGHR